MANNYYGYIYITKNLINNKIYIGQHKSSKYDSKYYGSGYALRSAIKKYGLSNFDNHIICMVKNKREADIMEKVYIRIFNSCKRGVGYNIADGGQGGYLMGNKSDKEKQAIYQKMINTRKEKGIGVGKNNPMYNSGVEGRHPLYGTHRSKETKSRISNSLKGHTPWNKGMKKIKSDRELTFDKVMRYLELKCRPVKSISDSGETLYFKNKKTAENFYNGHNLKYALKHHSKIINNSTYFKYITKEEYLSKNGEL